MFRRDFIIKGSALAFLPTISLEAAGLQQSAPFPFFDLHCHPGVFPYKGTPRYVGDEAVLKTVSEMRAGGVQGAFFSLVADMPLIKRTEKGIVPAGTFKKGEAWSEFKRQIEIIKGLESKLELKFATNSSDFGRGKVTALLAVEGGDFIEEVDLLEEAYEDGVRSVQIVHYVPNHLGDLQTAGSMHDGLSDMGKSVVKKMEQLGMVIDVAHASHQTVKDVVSLTDSPIILSHSILKMEPDRPISARAISVEHAELIASTGGVIGAWPSGFSKSFDEYTDNILRLVDVVGIDHVGVGTDMDANYKPVLNSYLQMPKLASNLLQRGLTKDEVSKLAYENILRVLKQVMG